MVVDVNKKIDTSI